MAAGSLSHVTYTASFRLLHLHSRHNIFFLESKTRLFKLLSSWFALAAAFCGVYFSRQKYTRDCSVLQLYETHVVKQHWKGACCAFSQKGCKLRSSDNCCRHSESLDLHPWPWLWRMQRNPCLNVHAWKTIERARERVLLVAGRSRYGRWSLHKCINTPPLYIQGGPRFAKRRKCILLMAYNGKGYLGMQKWVDDQTGAVNPVRIILFSFLSGIPESTR